MRYPHNQPKKKKSSQKSGQNKIKKNLNLPSSQNHLPSASNQFKMIQEIGISLNALSVEAHNEDKHLTFSKMSTTPISFSPKSLELLEAFNPKNLIFHKPTCTHTRLI